MDTAVFSWIAWLCGGLLFGILALNFAPVHGSSSLSKLRERGLMAAWFLLIIIIGYCATLLIKYWAE